MDEPILKVSNLHVSFSGNEVLKGLSFDVKKGEVVAIVGPNGAGKSVLLRTLLGLHPYHGTIKWTENLKINYVPQKVYIDKDMPLNGHEFLSFKEKDPDKILSALKSVGFKDEHHIRSHLLKKPLGIFSGGQLQRLLIAWSIIDNPDVILFDEPTAGIDVGGEETIYKLLKDLQEQKHITVLFVTHNMHIIHHLADRVLEINKEVICYKTPDEALKSKCLAKLYGEDFKLTESEHPH